MGGEEAERPFRLGGGGFLAVGLSLILFFAPSFIGTGGSFLMTALKMSLTVFSMIFVPAPLIWLYRGGGVAAGRWGAIAATVIALGLILGTEQAGGGEVNFIYYAALAMAAGEALAALGRDEWAIGAGFAAATVVLGGLALVLGPFSGQGIGEFLHGQVDGDINRVVEMYKAGGMDPEMVAGLTTLLKTMVKLLPGMALAASLLLVWANVVATRLNQPPPAEGLSLVRWRAPEVLVWGFIGAVVLVVVADGWMFWLGANLLLLLAAVYLLQGLAVMAFWLRKKNVPRPARAALYTIVVLMEVLVILLAAAGLFDIWFDFRRLKKAKAA